MRKCIKCHTSLKNEYLLDENIRFNLKNENSIL